MFLAYLQSFGFIQSTKISDLMDMPPVALISFSGKSPSELYYPKPLMQLWKECTKVNSAKASSSGHCIISNFVSFEEICSLMENMRWKQELTEWTSQMALSAEYDSAYDTLLSDHSVAIGSRSANAIRKWKVIVHLW